ncbi:MAG: hypothetical protein ACD_51C00065G0008 [uncultured bacterium]|nr:MAG: hypothetical protein ACD_51C00065G0008 [uncultured bacterium]OGJ47726.1 MAG: hypothetical protein A2244_03805 [Candidatus Peregrinibacteria bacterium RIFOXYA2_FULL_41_18]
MSKFITIIVILISQIPSWIFQDDILQLQKIYATVSRLPTRVLEPELYIQKDPTEIFLFGDLMLGRYIATLRGKYAESDPTFPLSHFQEIISTYSEDPEIVAVNLEGPITDETISYCDLCFSFKPEVASLIKQQGITMAMLANNHMRNQGENGYEDTRIYLTEAGVNYVGVPNEINELSSYIQEINGIKIGWLGFNEVEATLDYTQAISLTKQVAEESDFTIVAIHWGTEYVNTPSSKIQDYGHQFIDAGADVVWGTHPHVIESIENYSDGMIFYSLGNLAFDQYWSAGTQEGLGVMIKIEDKDEVDDPTFTLIPLKLTDNKGDPYLMEGEQKTSMLARLKKYSETIGVMIDENMNFDDGILRPW